MTPTSEMRAAAEMSARLRSEQSVGWSGDACAVDCELANAAAELIDALVAEVERLREGLADLRKVARTYRQSRRYPTPAKFDRDPKAERGYHEGCYLAGKHLDDLARALLTPAAEKSNDC